MAILSGSSALAATEQDLAAFGDAVRVVGARHGWMAVPIADTIVGRSILCYGEFAELECALLRRAVPPDAVILDVGANLGSHSLAFAAMAPAGRVIALEPQPAIFTLLRANLALNRLDRVEAIHAAAGERAGQCRIPGRDLAAPGNFGRYQLEDVPGGGVTPVITIDSLGLDRLDLMKCDVEGMERAVLAGAVATVDRHRPVLYVENDRPPQAVALVDWLLQASYRVWWHTPRYFSPDNWRDVDTDCFDGMRALNLLALPAEGVAMRAEMTRGLVEIRRPGSAWPPIILA